MYVVWDDILRFIFEYSGSQATRSNYQRVYKANAVFTHGRKPHAWTVVSPRISELLCHSTRDRIINSINVIKEAMIIAVMNAI